MKRSSVGKRVAEAPPPEKSSWLRQFCGRGFFREIWKNRFVILRQEQLLICHKEVKEARRAEEVLDLLDFDVCEEVRKSRSRSKKNHSKFRLIQSHRGGGARVNSVVFLALSPEEKESWIQVLNQALNRAKNRVLDQVTVEDSSLSHLTRDRAKILHTRRLPTRGHLLAVASASSDGALTLDLIQEDQTRDQHPDQTRPKFKSPTETSEKPHTLPRQVVSTRKSLSSEKSLSLDQIPQNSSPETKTDTQSRSRSGSNSKSGSISRLQELIQEKIQRTEELLTDLSLNQDPDQRPDLDQDQKPDQAPGSGPVRLEAQELLSEALDQWTQAHRVLIEVQELKELCLKMDSSIKHHANANCCANAIANDCANALSNDCANANSS